MASFERMRQDLGFAARLMRKAPGFSATAVLTLAIGVGASTAIFSQINAVFWKTLPVDRPQELRSLVWYAQRHPFVLGPNVIAGPSVAGVDTFGSFSYPAYTAMRDGTKSFSQLACWADLGEARPVVMRDVGFGTVHFVSGNYFDTLGVRAAIGRTLVPDDDTPATTAAVLSDPFWRRSFAARTDVLQHTIDLNGKAFAIVGVMPRGFFGVDASTIPDVIVPAGAVQLAASTVNALENPVLWQIGVGLALGAAAAVAAARWVNALLFGVAAYDPRTIAGAASVFLTIAALAALMPALRASRIDPLGALRSE